MSTLTREVQMHSDESHLPSSSYRFATPLYNGPHGGPVAPNYDLPPSGSPPPYTPVAAAHTSVSARRGFVQQVPLLYRSPSPANVTPSHEPSEPKTFRSAQPTGNLGHIMPPSPVRVPVVRMSPTARRASIPTIESSSSLELEKIVVPRMENNSLTKTFAPRVVRPTSDPSPPAYTPVAMANGIAKNEPAMEASTTAPSVIKEPLAMPQGPFSPKTLQGMRSKSAPLTENNGNGSKYAQLMSPAAACHSPTRGAASRAGATRTSHQRASTDLPAGGQPANRASQGGDATAEAPGTGRAPHSVPVNRTPAPRVRMAVTEHHTERNEGSHCASLSPSGNAPSRHYSALSNPCKPSSLPPPKSSMPTAGSQLGSVPAAGSQLGSVPAARSQLGSVPADGLAAILDATVQSLASMTFIDLVGRGIRKRPASTNSSEGSGFLSPEAYSEDSADETNGSVPNQQTLPCPEISLCIDEVSRSKEVFPITSSQSEAPASEATAPEHSSDTPITGTQQPQAEPQLAQPLPFISLDPPSSQSTALPTSSSFTTTDCRTNGLLHKRLGRRPKPVAVDIPNVSTQGSPTNLSPTWGPSPTNKSKLTPSRSSSNQSSPWTLRPVMSFVDRLNFLDGHWALSEFDMANDEATQQSWVCTVCNTENTTSQLKCIACLSPRLFEGQQHHVWKCTDCGANNPLTRTVCRLCYHPAGKRASISICREVSMDIMSVISETDSGTLTPATPVVPRGGFRPWTCFACNSVNIKARCERCGADRRDVSQWASCPRCGTSHSKDSKQSSCAACGTPFSGQQNLRVAFVTLV